MGVEQFSPKLYRGLLSLGGTISNMAITPKSVYDAFYSPTGDFVPFTSQNYFSVKASGNALSNGTKLVTAIASAYASTPNGLALSNTNRAVIYLFAGTYDIGATTLNIGQFVDIIGLGDRQDIIIQSTGGTFPITVNATNNYNLRNLTINSGSTGSIQGTTTDSGNWDSLILNGRTGLEVSYNGTYNNILCNAGQVLAGDIIGTVSNSSFQNNSCGYKTGNITFSGYIYNCTATTQSFINGTNITFSGKMINCTATSNVMGTSNNFGIVTYTSTALTQDCTASSNAFGRTEGAITLDGTFINCTITAGSGFGYNITASALVQINSTALFINCRATSSSFCVSTAGTESNSGKFYNCVGGAGCFGNSTTSALFFECTRTAGYGTHAGSFESCNFRDNSAGDALKLSTGARVRYSTIYQQGAGITINGNAATTAQIYHCSLNKAINAVNVTNLIATPFNVVDANLTL